MQKEEADLRMVNQRIRSKKVRSVSRGLSLPVKCDILKICNDGFVFSQAGMESVCAEPIQEFPVASPP